MTDYEKLVELIDQSLKRYIDKSCKLAENIASDLMAGGVTVCFDRRLSGMVIEERGGNHIRNCWFCLPENLKRLEVSA